MIQKHIVVIFAIMIFFTMINYAYAQETENVNVEIKYTNGDIVDFYEVNLIVYQNFQNTPIIQKQITSNPYTISVPKDQRYQIDVFVNGMYGGTKYVDLKKDSTNVIVNIPLSGGIKFNTFFEDGHTPVKGATVVIKSHDGKKWRETHTNEKGETLRFWLQSTTKDTDYYTAEVYLGNILAKTVSNIKVQEGIAQDQKIVIPIPKIIEDLVTITLYKSPTEKISKDDGDYSVSLSKTNSDFSKKSPVTYRGEANFSNLEPGEYIVRVLKDNKISDEWEDKTVTIIGTQNKFEVKKIIKQINVNDETATETIQSCNCVAFRFDDAQDYWLNEVQKSYVKKFVDDEIPLTVGIIADSFGNDSVITDIVKEGIKRNFIEIANHGMANTPLEGMSKEEQTSQIQNSENMIRNSLNVNSKVFIPPQNRFDDITKQVLIENKYTHMSSSMIYDYNLSYPLENQTLYRFPEIVTTGRYDVEKNIFVGTEHAETFQKTIDGLEKYGFAVITSHPQEFAVVRNGTYTNEINSQQFSELELLIDKIKSEGIRIVSISKISTDTNYTVVPVWIKNNAGWWADGQIDDSTFVQGIQYLIKEGIMKIPPTTQDSTNTKDIPTWIKNNARWWADGLISDSDFVKGIEFLVKNQIIRY